MPINQEALTVICSGACDGTLLEMRVSLSSEHEMDIDSFTVRTVNPRVYRW